MSKRSIAASSSPALLSEALLSGKLDSTPLLDKNLTFPRSQREVASLSANQLLQESYSYTSLKDVLSSYDHEGSSSASNRASLNLHDDEIPIKNPLVKCAALAYLRPQHKVLKPSWRRRGSLKEVGECFVIVP
ncbi:hypothetical protein FRX31_023910, partial [Thalictrum thalictroides]